MKATEAVIKTVKDMNNLYLLAPNTERIFKNIVEDHPIDNLVDLKISNNTDVPKLLRVKNVEFKSEETRTTFKHILVEATEVEEVSIKEHNDSVKTKVSYFTLSPTDLRVYAGPREKLRVRSVDYTSIANK